MRRFLVIGVGSIGERHLKNLQLLKQEVFVYDRDVDKMKKMVEKYGVSIYDFKSHHLHIDAFIICTPPAYHIAFAEEALEHEGCHIFIEKPLSNTLDKVDDVIAEIEKKKLISQVGYQLRFHPGLQLVKKLLDNNTIGKILSIRAEYGYDLQKWHPQEPYQNLYTCYEEEGGGIISDSSHELDYVMWLTNSIVSKISCFMGKLSNLNIDVEDTAEINLLFNNNLIGNIHVDMIQKIYTRWCKIIGDKGNIYWDYNWNGEVLLNNSRFGVSNNQDPYLDEIKSFLQRIEKRDVSLASIKQSKKVLELSLLAKRSSKEARVIEIQNEKIL